MTDSNDPMDKAHPIPWRLLAWSGAAVLLLLPLIAMQFTDELRWDGFDFLVFGIMLATVGGLLELATRMSRNHAYRMAAAIAAINGFLIVWSSLAVGIIGNENNPANLMFFAVLGIPLIGAYVSRMRADAMARTMMATAGGQGLALLAGLAMGDYDVLLTVFFIGAWLLSAALFRKAANQEQSN